MFHFFRWKMPVSVAAAVMTSHIFLFVYSIIPITPRTFAKGRKAFVSHSMENVCTFYVLRSSCHKQTCANIRMNDSEARDDGMGMGMARVSSEFMEM